MPIRQYTESNEIWLVSCPVCNPEIPEAIIYEPLPFKLVPYRVLNVEVALDIEVPTETGTENLQVVTIKLKCKNGHTWKYSLQAGDGTLSNVLIESEDVEGIEDGDGE